MPLPLMRGFGAIVCPHTEVPTHHRLAQRLHRELAYRVRPGPRCRRWFLTGSHPSQGPWMATPVGKANPRLARFQRTERAKQSGSSMKNNNTGAETLGPPPNDIHGWQALE